MFLPSNITLKFGDSGDFVSELQRRLALVKCFDEAMINGFFDGNTVNAVTSFQSREGLATDGVAGPETLRRLNGVISGDTSSSNNDSKKEEEAAALEAQRRQNQINMLAPAPAEDMSMFMPAEPSHSPYGEDAYAKPAAPAVPAPPSREAVMGEQQMQSAQAQIEQAVQRDIQMQAQAQQADRSTLAALMAQAPQEPPAPKVPPPPSRESIEKAAAERAGAAAEPPARPVPAPPPRQEAPIQKPAEKPAEQQAASTAAEPPQPKGLVGRAMEMASGLVQKLHSYFEAKLPPSVLQEVQSIGVNMAKLGMKEVPIPTGPEMAQGKAQELPARGPEAGQQRG